MRFRATLPFIDSLGTVSPINCTETSITTKEQDLLWHLNHMREHDGLRPWDADSEGFYRVLEKTTWEELD